MWTVKVNDKTIEVDSIAYSDDIDTGRHITVCGTARIPDGSDIAVTYTNDGNTHTDILRSVHLLDDQTGQYTCEEILWDWHKP